MNLKVRWLPPRTHKGATAAAEDDKEERSPQEEVKVDEQLISGGGRLLSLPGEEGVNWGLMRRVAGNFKLPRRRGTQTHIVLVLWVDGWVARE